MVTSGVRGLLQDVSGQVAGLSMSVSQSSRDKDNKLSQLLGTVNNLQRECKALLVQNEALRRALNYERSNASFGKLNLERLDSETAVEVVKLCTAYENLQRVREQEKEDSVLLISEVEHLRHQVSDLTEKNVKLESELEHLRKHLSTNKDLACEGLRRELLELRERYADVAEQRGRALSELDEMRASLPRLHQSLKTEVAKKSHVLVEKLQEENELLRKKVQELDDRLFQAAFQ